jgi:hypothetical protein
MFHYLVVAHSLGVPKSFDPGPLASVPVTISGIGDKPGGDFMMTLGSWGNDFRGPEPIQIFTIAHELGHNLWRAHNGNPFSGFENNCNPQYLSVMNYMYQTKGLLNLLGEPQVDFSHVMNSDVNEISLPGGLGPMAYRAGWYAPRAGVHQTLQVTAATKHCDGSPLSQTEEDDRVAGGGYVRVDGTSLTTPPIDWNGDLNLNNDVGVAQDVTFNGTVNNGTTDTTKLLRGSEDWLSIAAFGLRQLGSRRSVNGLSLDAGRDGPGRDGPGRDGPGSADVGSMGDYGRDGPGRDGPGNEMDFDTATAFVHPPHSLKVERVSAKSATVSWKRGHVGTGAVTFLVYRVDGGVPISPAAFSKRVLIDETANLSTLDTKITAGKTYAYFALTKVTATGAISNMSNAFKYDALK